MESLPIVPSCALDESELRRQLDRYREIGRDARLVHRDEDSLVVKVDRGVDPAAVEATVAVEAECCPFLHPAWDGEKRRLGFSVARSAERPALGAVAFALGIETIEDAAPGGGPLTSPC